ncbi:hypothetical protein WA538_001470, partial [Blastocystis sp. DL]
MNAKKTIWSHNTVIPPKMFSCVLPDVYRSNLFGSESFSFIESLKLKSIVYLGNETLDEEWVAFCEESNISVFQISDNVVRPKDDWEPISEDSVKRAIEFLSKKANTPVLVMCKNGVEKTGIVIACLRKCHHWCFTSIIQEFRREAYEEAVQPNAELFIEFFSPDIVAIS